MKYEKASINVVAIGNDGTLDYSTQGMGNCKYCDQCNSFRLLPEPYNLFINADMKAVCLEVNGVIKGSLERPNKSINICKLLYCAQFGCELSEEEEKITLHTTKRRCL